VSQFRDREQAGRALAGALEQYRNSSVILYALPRGGVVVGAVVAQELGAPLELVIARKVGHPFSAEYAIGALTEQGPLVMDARVAAGIDEEWLVSAVARERQEARRRRERYAGNRAWRTPGERIVLLVDDGMATGLTMLAAVRELKQHQPKRVVVAVPVASPEAVEMVQQEVDEVVALVVPSFGFASVGAYYDEFDQVSDEEVIEILKGFYESREE
jgi:predicted phosphoribosyltransferase